MFDDPILVSVPSRYIFMWWCHVLWHRKSVRTKQSPVGTIVPSQISSLSTHIVRARIKKIDQYNWHNMYNIYNLFLEPETSTLKWLFQWDDSKSLHDKWLKLTKHPWTNLKNQVFGTPGMTYITYVGISSSHVGRSVVTIPTAFCFPRHFSSQKTQHSNQQKFHEAWAFSPTKRMHFVTCLPRNLNFLVHGTGPTRPHLAVRSRNGEGVNGFLWP